MLSKVNTSCEKRKTGPLICLISAFMDILILLENVSSAITTEKDVMEQVLQHEQHAVCLSTRLEALFLWWGQVSQHWDKVLCNLEVYILISPEFILQQCKQASESRRTKTLLEQMVWPPQSPNYWNYTTEEKKLRQKDCDVGTIYSTTTENKMWGNAPNKTETQLCRALLIKVLRW